MHEPEWAQMGYGSTEGIGYSAECRICGAVAELPFGDDEKYYLSEDFADNEVYQDELFAYVFFFVLEKLRRECDCTEDERQSYERGRSLGPLPTLPTNYLNNQRRATTSSNNRKV